MREDCNYKVVEISPTSMSVVMIIVGLFTALNVFITTAILSHVMEQQEQIIQLLEQ